MIETDSCDRTTSKSETLPLSDLWHRSWSLLWVGQTDSLWIRKVAFPSFPETALPSIKDVAHSGHFLAWKESFKTKLSSFFIHPSLKKNNSGLLNISSSLMGRKGGKLLCFFFPINQEWKSPRINPFTLSQLYKITHLAEVIPIGKG